MIVGYHAPPPGSHTGIADYAETLRVALQRLGPVGKRSQRVECRRTSLPPGQQQTARSYLCTGFGHPGSCCSARRRPASFSARFGFSREQYIAEWVYNYGEWRRDLGEELWRERGKASVNPEYFRFPMLRRIVERSLRIVVRNPGAAAMVQAAKPVDIIPHFCEVTALPGAAELARFRERDRHRASASHCSECSAISVNLNELCLASGRSEGCMR